jgi:isopentenyl-diphosphate delta-isomerase
MAEEERSRVAERKREGLEMALRRQVEARETSTLLEYVHLIHNALPELNFDEVTAETTFLEHRFKAPLLIDSMTGGTKEALKINGNLAEAAEATGLGMGVGSQRAALLSEELAETYRVARKRGPNIFLAANIGGAQLARGLKIEEVERLIQMIEADALIVHLNPLQELVQPEGEPHFRGVLARIEELCRTLQVPVIVKEVGAGISKEVATRLELAGVRAINVAGLGGTSWTGIEALRAEAGEAGEKAELGLLLWDWGIPTAAAILEVCRAVSIPVIASGGLRNGVDVAKCLALGASMAAMALPFLRAAAKSVEEVVSLIERTIYQLRAVMFVTGSRDVEALRRARYILTGPLREWAQAL